MTKKKTYNSPTLTRFGEVKQLTAGGTGTEGELFMLNFGMFMFDFCLDMVMTRSVDCIP